MIKGMTVILVDKVKTGTDALNRPVYEEVEIPVENVLVGQPSTDDITSTLDLTGKKAVYTLGIPKGDTHNWKDRKVRFFGRDWKTFGIPMQGIEANIPLSWGMNVMVEAYE